MRSVKYLMYKILDGHEAGALLGVKMYEIGHDGIQCEFLPPFDLKVSLDNSPNESSSHTFSILFLLDKLRNLDMDSLQVV